MKQNYSFLKDELALAEIRKHKWLESEKLGTEVGFATAALDWIKKYGEAWLQYRLQNTADDNPFVEKRRQQRFVYAAPITVKSSRNQFSVQTNDISLAGVSCTIPDSLPENLTTEVALALPKKNGKSSHLQFKTRIRRVIHTPEKGYRVFLPFTDAVRDYLLANTGILSN